MFYWQGFFLPLSSLASNSYLCKEFVRILSDLAREDPDWIPSETREEHKVKATYGMKILTGWQLISCLLFQNGCVCIKGPV